jgi:DNA polymerase III epsilon subunit-like protein
MTINMYSDNIIFYDTEFSTLDPYKGEILSVGLVKLNGEELYLELEYDGEVSEWVKENILPTLNQPKISREEAIKKIKEFVGDNSPYMVAYVNQFDAIYTYKLFGTGNEPFYWLPIDFASILFAHNCNPADLHGICKKLGIDYEKYHIHCSIDDARLLRDVYIKFTGNQIG